MDRSDDWRIGRIKGLHADRGFAFLDTDGDSSVFLHHTVMPQFDGLREGDAVEFRPVQPEPPKGPRAGKARKATDGA